MLHFVRVTTAVFGAATACECARTEQTSEHLVVGVGCVTRRSGANCGTDGGAVEIVTNALCIRFAETRIGTLRARLCALEALVDAPLQCRLVFFVRAARLFVFRLRI